MPDNDKRSSAKETILVVDDEVLIRLAISEYLRDCGYRVIEAANGDEAISVLRYAQVQVDVVFTDIEMPGAMDGFGLSRWVRANRPDVDVVLAGTIPRAVDAASHLCEKNDSVSKPYEAQVVLDRIRRLMAARVSRKPKAEMIRSNKLWGALNRARAV